MTQSPELETPLPPEPPDAAIADVPLEKLSVEAERAMASALQLAIDAQQAYVGSEHVLLGVLGQDGCRGAIGLLGLGVTQEFVTARLQPSSNPVNTTTQRPIPSPRLANALMRSILRSADPTVIDSCVLVDGVLEGDGAGRLILGEAGVTPEKWGEAVTALGTVPQETAVGRFSQAFSRLWSQRGVSRLRTNRLEDARADFVLVLGSATSDRQAAYAANSLAWTELCIGDADRLGEALELAERAAAKIPDQRYVRGTLAFALIENGRVSDGVEILVTDSIQGEDDWGTASRACVLAIGVARVGNGPYAEVLLQVAEQLEPPSGLPARVREAITKAPSTAASASVSEDSVPAAVQTLRYHPKLRQYVLVLAAYRRIYPTRVTAAAAERLRCVMTKAVLPGGREWIELLLAALRSRGASLRGISLDRKTGGIRCTISVKDENGGWGFEVAASDAAVIALAAGLPIRVSAEQWRQYSMSDPLLQSTIRKVIRWIFRRW